jgi:nucleoside-diphosphate-sugar epimerase
MLPPAAASGIVVRIAITGAGGQVGSQLAAALAEHQPAIEVIAVCRNAFSAKKLSAARCEVRTGSLLDPEGVRKVLDGCDTVIQSALSWDNLGRRDSVNLRMIRAIADAGVRRLVLLSTVAVYSSCIQSGINTYSDPRPDSEYGRDKVMCEREVTRLFSQPGRRGFVLRLGHVYGPSLLWSRRFLMMARDHRFKLPFDGGPPSNAVRIDRVSAAVAALFESDLAGGVFNLTDEPNRPWREVFDWHTRACGLFAVEDLGEINSQELRAHYIGLKRTGLAHATGEIARALVAAATHMTTASQLLKEAGRAVLGWMPARAEQVLRSRHLASIVRRELGAAAGLELWEPSLAILFSDPAPGPGLPATPQTPAAALTEQDLIEKLSAWYARWTSPDALWLEQPPAN